MAALAGWLALAPLAGWAQADSAEDQSEPQAEDAPMAPAGEDPAADGAISVEPAAEAEPKPGAASVESYAPSAQRPQIAVVVLSGVIGRPFDTQVDRNVLRALSRTMVVVPMTATHRAVAAVHGNGTTLRTPAKLLEIGHELDVPFVVVLEATGRPRATSVFAGLVDTEGGRTLLGHKQPIPRNTLDAAAGRAIAERIEAAVTARWAHRRRRQAAPPPAAVDEPVAEAPAEGKDDEPPRPDHPAKDREEDLAGRPTMEPVMLPRARLGAGFKLMQRISHLKAAQSGGISPPCYCGSKNNAQPFFPALVISGELSTGLFTRQRVRPLDSIGLRADFQLAPVKTRVIQGTSTSTVNSLVLGLDANLFYRLAFFPHRAITPDIDFHVGVHWFSFPLKQTQYTSVAYLSPNLGVTLDLPFKPQVGVFFGFDLRPGMSAGSSAKAALGGKPKPGIGVAATAGVRGGWRLLGLDLAFRYEYSQVGYSGTTALANMPNNIQFSNVKLTDQIIGLMARAHLTF